MLGKFGMRVGLIGLAGVIVAAVGLHCQAGVQFAGLVRVGCSRSKW